MKKYEFTGETMRHGWRTLRRIRRLSDGAIGGWIEKEDNLSHYGDCWVFDSAQVYDSAQVFGDEVLTTKALALSGTRYLITVLDSTVIWGCRIFDRHSLNEFQFSDCTSEWDRQEFEDEKALVIAACRRKWGV